MPHRISRQDALARLGDPVECRLCELARAPDEDTLFDDGVTVVRLSRYPVRWGQIMVVPRAHAERYAALAADDWGRASELAHRAAIALETALRPSRCYVASLGVERTDLPMTFAHVHFNVLPVMEPETRPREVFTWQDGVMDGSPEEWAGLRAALRAAWDA